MDEIEKLQKIINESSDIVFFSGAGVSTNSGLRDFKGKNGLYTQSKEKVPEYMLSSKCFNQEPNSFYEYYKQHFDCLQAKPNIVHEYLAKLEGIGKLSAIITQNIDGLHTKAGSKNVYEIHGTIYENYCTLCNKFYSAEYVFHSNGIPKCDCGGIIKPNVVLYGEMLPECFLKAQEAIYHADTLIVAGTSLTVEPAASLVRLFHGKYLVILNDTPTIYDKKASLIIHTDLKNVFRKLTV